MKFLTRISLHVRLSNGQQTTAKHLDSIRLSTVQKSADLRGTAVDHDDHLVLRVFDRLRSPGLRRAFGAHVELPAPVRAHHHLEARSAIGEADLRSAGLFVFLTHPESSAETDRHRSTVQPQHLPDRHDRRHAHLDSGAQVLAEFRSLSSVPRAVRQRVPEAALSSVRDVQK